MMEESKEKQINLLTIKELGKTLDCSRGTVFNMVRRGDLKPIRLGKMVRFDWNDVQDLIERSKQ